ncbi:MAG: GAF domain-containing protein [Chloroflexi bacterium]|nr:GAF domain-containing protein [Chloroflexota bacterium]
MDDSRKNRPRTEWGWIEALPTSALVISSDRKVLAVNSACVDEFGYARDELIGKPADFLVPAYAWPPAPRGLTLSLTAETASGAINPVDVFLGPASFDANGTGEISDAYLAMVMSVEYESAESAEDNESTVRELLSDIGRIISSSLDIQSVCEQFSLAVMRSVPTERVAICATNDGSDQHHIIHAAPAAPGPPQQIIKFEADAFQDAFETQAPVLVTADELTDIVSGDLAPLGWSENNTKAIVIVPLVAGSTRIGALLLASSRPDAFSFDDIDLLGQVAGHVAGTISNLQLHADLQRESTERQLLANVAREASSVVEFSAAIGPIAEELSHQMDIARLEIASLDRSVTGGALRLSWIKADKDHSINERFTYSGSIEESVALEMLPLFASGEELDDLRQHYSSDQLNSTEWGTFIAVPMTMLGQVVGILTVRSESVDAYTAENVELLTRVADQLAGALQSARMYGRQQKEAEIKRSLAAISVAVSEDLELQRVFERVSDQLAVLVRYDHLTVSSVQRDDDRKWQAFSIGVEFSIPERDPESPDSWQDPDTWSGRSLGARPRGPLGKAMKKARLNSLIEVPLGTQASGHIGYLTIMNRDGNAYTDNDLSLVAQVAAQVTPAIQNAMSHEQALELAESREKHSLLEAKSAELERVNEAKSQFLAMVSHELRTPLTAISAYTDILGRNSEGNLIEKQVTQIGVIRRNATHLNKLISDLLDISKIESAAFSLAKVNFDLGEMVLDLVESLEPLVSAKEQQITADVTEGIELIADKEKITQVVSNLIENAVKYSPVGADISIEISPVDGAAEIVVSDNGYGISKADQERIFETFFRSRTEENWEVPGTGLGLSLVKRIVSMHGGTISIDSEPGVGTSFTILLPISSDEEIADANQGGVVDVYLGTDVTDSDPESPEARAVAVLRKRRNEIIRDEDVSASESDIETDAVA